MSTQFAKVQELFNKRIENYEATTVDILEGLQFAVDGIQNYFITIGLPVTVSDITIAKGVFIFIVIVDDKWSERPQIFNVGIPLEVLATQSSDTICKFLIATNNEAKNNKSTTKRQLH